MIWKKVETTKGESTLYIFHNGDLFYKRWLSRNRGVVIDAYGGAFMPPRDPMEDQPNEERRP